MSPTGQFLLYAIIPSLVQSGLDSSKWRVVVAMPTEQTDAPSRGCASSVFPGSIALTMAAQALKCAPFVFVPSHILYNMK